VVYLFIFLWHVAVSYDQNIKGFFKSFRKRNSYHIIF